MKTKPLFIAAAVALCSALSTFAADNKEAELRPFATADKDGDRRISLEEYVAFMAKTLDEKAARAKFAQFDKDKDGYLTRQEFRASRGEPEYKR